MKERGKESKQFKINPLLVRRHISWAEKCPEGVEFINNLDRYYTIDELRQLITERFGPEKTPSRSALGRFLRMITQAHTLAREDSHGK